jgi:CPA1 family monovalent cation:H+ antiporter
VEINQLQQEYPNLQSFTVEQLRGELLAIEANTYAEFVKAGRLNKELSPLLPEVLHTGDE